MAILTLKSLCHQMIQSWRILTSTPWHKRMRLSFFLLGMWLLYVFIPTRNSILLACYLWFRYVDDVADQELENPLATLKEFIEAKRKFLKRLSEFPYESIDCSGVDWLMFYAHARCLKLGFDIIPSMMEILEAVAYDVERSRANEVPSQGAISLYFKKLDWPTVRETLRIIGEEAIQPEELIGFMDATRDYFNLRDLLRDFEVGLVNISAEETQAYGIDMNLCAGMRSLDELMKYSPLKRWFMDQLSQMKYNLNVGMEILRGKRVMLVTRLMLYVGFAIPCKNFAKRWEGSWRIGRYHF